MYVFPSAVKVANRAADIVFVLTVRIFICCDRVNATNNCNWTISYIIPHTFSNELQVHLTDAVTVCLLRIFTFEQIILNTVTVAKHLVVLTVLKYSCVVIFAKLSAHVVCIHKEGSILCKV